MNASAKKELKEKELGTIAENRESTKDLVPPAENGLKEEDLSATEEKRYVKLIGRQISDPADMVASNATAGTVDSGDIVDMAASGNC